MKRTQTLLLYHCLWGRGEAGEQLLTPDDVADGACQTDACQYGIHNLHPGPLLLCEAERHSEELNKAFL